MRSFDFNGTRKDFITIAKGWSLPAWAPINRTFINVPGMPGAMLSNTETDPRRFDLPIILLAKDFAEKEALIEELASWLITDKPVALKFDKYPNRTLYAVVEGTIDFEEFWRIGEGTISFVCPDPYKYGPQKTVPTSSAIISQGTASSHPVFKIKVTAPTTFLAISNGVKMNMIGNPTDIDVAPINRLTRLLWDQGNNLVPWTPPTSIEGGAIAGAMMTDGYMFKASTSGTGTGWHGPALKRGVSELVKNFEVDVLIELTNIVSGAPRTGKVVVSLLDQANNVVGSVTAVNSSSPGRVNLIVRAGNEANGEDIIKFSGNTDAIYNNFYGILRIGRNGNTWYGYVARVNKTTGKHDFGLYDEWLDDENKYTLDLAQVQTYIAGFSTRQIAAGAFDDIKVSRINNVNDNQIPYISQAGDVFEFDHINQKLTRNGEDIRTSKAFIGDYFKLSPGLNNVTVEPSTIIETSEVRWRDKWL